MQNISASLDSTIANSAQIVEPFVEAEWVNGRSLKNVQAYSSSDDYIEFVKAQNPSVYLRLNESFDAIDGMYTGPKPITHWRMNNPHNGLAVQPNVYAVQDETGYNNLLVKGVAGSASDFLFGGNGVVQDNTGELSTGLSFISGSGYGASSQRDISNKWSIMDNPNFSVECWIKPSTINAGDNNYILYKDSKGYLRSQESGEILLTASIPEWTLNLDGGKPKFSIYNSYTGYWAPLANKANIYVDVKSDTALVVNKWYHIVVTFDGKTLSLYVNNQLVKSNNVLNGTLLDTASGSIYVAAQYIDYFATPLQAGKSFIGHIDECAIYHNTLTMQNVKQRWRSGSLNVGRDNRSAGSDHSHIKDYSSYGRNPFIYNPNNLSTTPTAGVASPFTGIDFRPEINGSMASPFNGRKDGAAFYFNDGTSIVNYQYLTNDNSATGTSIFDGTAKLTVSAWIYVEDKTVASESIEMIAAVGASSGEFHTVPTVSNGSWYITLRRQTNGTVNLSGSIYNGTGSSPIATYTNIARNQWNHFVFSVDSSNRAVIMVNGNTSSVATSATSSSTMNANAQWKLFVGGRQSTEGLTKCFLSELSISNTNADLFAWSAAYQSVISINNFKSLNKFYDPEQVVNGQNEHTLPWAVLDALDENGDVITANGTYYISEREETLATTDYEYGWWSKMKSDASGNFTIPQKIYISFDPVYANYIDLYSSTKYGRIKSGSFRFRDADTSSWTAVNFNLSSSSYIYSIGQTKHIDALELTVTATLYPFDVARVQEFAPRWTQDVSDRVVSFDVSKVRENYDSSVPLGATGANTANITLDNTDLEMNPDNTGSAYYGVITPGVKFTLGYNYHTNAGIELVPQGIFYSDNWNIDSANMTVSVSCRDFSNRMQDRSLVDGYLAADVTAGEAIEDIALRAGVPLSKVNVDKNYVNTVLADKPAVFWRMNETSMDQKSLFFNGTTYLYSHPFGDQLATTANSLGTKKNTTIASRNILPRTFYDFPSTEGAIEFWIKCGSGAHGKTIVNYATKRFANEFRIKVSNTGYLVTQVQNFAPGAAEPVDASGVTSSIKVADDIWHHVCIVIDPTTSAVAGGVRILYYVDGVAAASGDVANFSPFRPSGQMLVGAGFTAGGISSNVATGPHTLNAASIFTGHLRELKIWSTTRAQTQIFAGINYPHQQQKIHANSSYIYKNMILAESPCAYWPLDLRLSTGANSKLLRDISGFDRNGVQSGTSITSTDGPIVNEDSSRALNFNGASSYFSVSNMATTPFEGSATTIDAAHPYISQYDLNVFPNSTTKEPSFTLEFWLSPNSTPSSTKAIMAKLDTSSNTLSEWRISLRSDRKVEFQVFNTSRQPMVSLVSRKVIPLNQWSHIAVIASGAKAVFVINGKLSGQAFFDTGTYATNLNSSLYIGNDPSNLNALDAKIAHIAIYKRALSIESLYRHYSKAGYDDQIINRASTGRLACHWPMNQGRFYAFEDLNKNGFAYTSAGRRKENIVPNITKNGNHLFSYTSTAATPIDQSMWKATGSMSIKDSAGKNFASWRLGTSGDQYNEMLAANYVTFNNTSPISSEVEKSILLNNTTSAVKNIGYINYMDSCSLVPDASNSFTLEWWMRPTNTTYKQYILAREDFGTTVKAGTWRLFLNASGVLKFEIFQADGAPSAYSITPSGIQSAITANEWHHVAVTMTRSAGNYVLTIYVDGESYSQYIWSASTTPITSGYVKTIIGGYGLANDNAFIGSLSNMAIYNYSLSTTQIVYHYERGQSLYQQVYANIGAAGDSYWSEMLRIATADIGMFYFDENNNFIYEHGRSYDDAMNTQHAEVQYEINDGNLISIGSSVVYNIDATARTYGGLYPVTGTVSYSQYGGASDSTAAIISGSQTVELQVNKVIVKVYPPTTTSIAKSGIWSAEGGTSLAICTLSSNLGATSTDVISLNLTLNTAGVYEPVWPEGGVVKINDEFIRYKKISGNTLFDLERGYWNSVPQNHLAGSVVGEAREFSLEWSNSPVFFVSYPFITGVIYDKTVVASNWRFNGLGGYIRVYPSDNAVSSNKYIVLEGNNPVTKLDNFFRVAGIVMSSGEKNKQNIVEISEDYKDNIRRYGEKTLEIDNSLIQDAQYARDLAQFLLQKYALPVPILQVSTIGLPQLQLGDRIKINTFDRLSILNGEYWVMSIEMSYNGGIDQRMTLKKVS